MLADVLRIALEQLQLEGRRETPQEKLLRVALELELGSIDLVPKTFWYSGENHQGLGEIRVLYRRKEKSSV